MPAEEIERLIAERQAARRATRLRARPTAFATSLAARGVLLEDSAGGTRWKRR